VRLKKIKNKKKNLKKKKGREKSKAGIHGGLSFSSH
jgi:hypothetical protein